MLLMLPGCGKKKVVTRSDDTEGRPEWVTAYEAMQYCKPAADKWEKRNWVTQIRDGDPDGINKAGRGRIWEVYFFSPRPEEHSELFVIYNRGHVWPNAPVECRGGDKGLETYRQNKPKPFLVDSGEAYAVGLRNGGGEYLDSRADAQVHAVLRCKADYDAVGAAMPAPNYKWIWDVTYREPRVDSEILHVMVDGMNGEFITRETQKPTS
ncbi:MAG: hypothetical protein MUP40_00880 [Actinobacteria bacterium]|nr:hypothetical protein [Actinomycetota bacterium]